MSSLWRHGRVLATLDAWIVSWPLVGPSFVAAALFGGCATSPRSDAARASLSTAVAMQWHSPLGLERSYHAAEARVSGAHASLYEREDACHSVVTARGTQIEQQREAVMASVETDRAIGGGWTPSSQTTRQTKAPQ